MTKNGQLLFLFYRDEKCFICVYPVTVSHKNFLITLSKKQLFNLLLVNRINQSSTFSFRMPIVICCWNFFYPGKNFARSSVNIIRSSEDLIRSSEDLMRSSEDLIRSSVALIRSSKPFMRLAVRAIYFEGNSMRSVMSFMHSSAS